MKKLIFAGLMMISTAAGAMECKISLGSNKATGEAMVKTDCGAGPSIQVFESEAYALSKAADQFRQLTLVYTASGWSMGADQATPGQEYHYHRTFTSPAN